MSDKVLLPVHILFERQAVATPNAVAIAFENAEWTYEQLNSFASRHAHRLIEMGVSRGDRVGLCLGRGFDAVVGMLGILKAGGAYVPLDPEYPTERLSYMVRDAGTKFVLCEPSTIDRLAQVAPNATHLCLDTSREPMSFAPTSNLGIPCESDEPIYVMYTSGSTGNPKGVVVPHRGVTRLVRETNYCQFGPEQTSLLMAPLTFDASTFEIWGALLNGGKLAILRPGTPTLALIAETVQRHKVTTVWLTAGLFHLVVEQRIDAIASLKQILAGGDVLLPRHVQSALNAMRDGVVINGYGPTESTTFACCFRMERGYQVGTTIPIGSSISNTSVRIVDENLQAVKPGDSGELLIGGAGLALGYLNHDGLTRDKFIADPLSSDPGERLYRTGDRVREMADGNIEFLGRIDEQVKISGHRIEPGEIEASLRTHPNVQQAAVVAVNAASTEKCLVAFVTCAEPGAFNVDELRRHLVVRLPKYMVPSRFVIRSVLPLTTNGKVDRKALIDDVPPPVPNVQSVESANTLERGIAEIWSRVLKCPVGMDDNFFDLGGSSLQLIEVHVALTNLVGREITLTTLFEFPTVRKLAVRLEFRDPKSEVLKSSTADRARLQREALARRKQAMEFAR